MLPMDCDDENEPVEGAIGTLDLQRKLTGCSGVFGYKGNCSPTGMPSVNGSKGQMNKLTIMIGRTSSVHCLQTYKPFCLREQLGMSCSTLPIFLAEPCFQRFGRYIPLRVPISPRAPSEKFFDRGIATICSGSIRTKREETVR